MNHLGKPLLALAICALGLAGLISGGPIERAPGVLAPGDPEQTATPAAAFRFGEFELTPMASYRIVARVLSVEPYRWDGGAALSPIDFALGWGTMSDSRVLEHFRITQGGRFFTLYPDAQAIEVSAALISSANVHLIPESGTVRRELLRVRPGHIVDLQGKLVNASRADGYRWNTSLTRSDSGAGACELFYVEAVSIR